MAEVERDKSPCVLMVARLKPHSCGEFDQAIHNAKATWVVTRVANEAIQLTK